MGVGGRGFAVRAFKRLPVDVALITCGGIFSVASHASTATLTLFCIIFNDLRRVHFWTPPGHPENGRESPASARLSFALVFPALAGLVLGFAVQDRMDQARFRKATLAVLAVAGLNLVRRGFFA